MPLLSGELFAVLEQELARGLVARGWPDHTWTLSRIKTLIGRRFHKSYTVPGAAETTRMELPGTRPPGSGARRHRGDELGEGEVA